MTANPDALRGLLAGVLRIDADRVTADSVLSGLGATSVAVMEIMVEVEDTFGIELTDAQMDEVVTVEDLRRLINDELDARAPKV